MLLVSEASHPSGDNPGDIPAKAPVAEVSTSGNLLCGLATNQHTMILGRVIAGIGGGGLISIATFLTSDLTPLRKRGIMQGIANLWYGAGAMLGAVIGGALKEHTVLG